jgi:DNA-binding NarL/FixJ family response regulator
MSRKPDEPTEREQEVWDRIGQGMTRKEVAEDLHISPKTYDYHRDNLLDKTGARNTIELAVLRAKWNSTKRSNDDSDESPDSF